MTKVRADLGFADELENFEPNAWTPKPPTLSRKRPPKAAAEKAAEAVGFRSREPKAGRSESDPFQKPASLPEKPQEAPLASEAGKGREGAQNPLRRRRTGRNVQFNLKTKPNTIEAFTAIADRNGWGFGETFERAVELLEREFSGKRNR